MVTAQGGKAHFHEDFIADGDYVKQLLENNYLDCMHELPSTVPIVRIKTTMDSFVDGSGGLLHSTLDVTLNDDPVGADPPATADAPVGACGDVVSGEPRGTSAAVRSASKSSGRIVESSNKNASSPADQPAAVASPAKRSTRKRRTRKRDKTVEKVTSGFEIQPPPVEPCVKRPRRTQKA